MSTYGGAVPWWRVVRADGTPLEKEESRARHLDEGTPLRPGGRGHAGRDVVARGVRAARRSCRRRLVGWSP